MRAPCCRSLPTTDAPDDVRAQSPPPPPPPTPPHHMTHAVCTVRQVAQRVVPAVRAGNVPVHDCKGGADGSGWPFLRDGGRGHVTTLHGRLQLGDGHGQPRRAGGPHAQQVQHIEPRGPHVRQPGRRHVAEGHAGRVHTGGPGDALQQHAGADLKQRGPHGDAAATCAYTHSVVCGTDVRNEQPDRLNLAPVKRKLPRSTGALRRRIEAPQSCRKSAAQ
jgi:hypothetical protein